MKVAIMQPYFYPYMGYFRLFKNSDLFVIYDCVQFPRRGWVHRNKIRMPSGSLEWLTLPIKKDSREIKIKDLEFQDQAYTKFVDRLRDSQILSKIKSSNSKLYSCLTGLKDNSLVIDYLIKNLLFVCKELNFNFNVIRSSELNIDDNKRGQERIISIIKRVGGKQYINLPGGKELYDAKTFYDNGINLSFIDTNDCRKISVLDHLFKQHLDDSI